MTETEKVKVTLVRRSTGIEIQVEGCCDYSVEGQDNAALYNIVNTLHDAIELTGDAAGYRTKRELTDEEKARKRAFAIQYNRAKRSR